jgi:hypothetical protein
LLIFHKRFANFPQAFCQFPIGILSTFHERFDRRLRDFGRYLFDAESIFARCVVDILTMLRDVSAIFYDHLVSVLLERSTNVQRYSANISQASS